MNSSLFIYFFSLTFQDLVVSKVSIGQLSEAEHLPHEHTKRPHIRLSGEVVLKHRLGWKPAQGDPGLTIMVILTTNKYTDTHSKSSVIWQIKHVV